jgi:hypothetical protein
MTRRWLHLAGLCLGTLSLLAGGLESYRISLLVSLQLQGKCDWVPCVNGGTYLALGLAIAIAIGGVVLLVMSARRFR